MSLTNLISVISSGEQAPSENVRDVFSVDVWTGNNPNLQAVVNNIDLATEGGMVWAKTRGAPAGTSTGLVAADNHSISDSETGSNNYFSLTTDVISTGVYGKSFNTDGFIPESGINYSDQNTGTVPAEYVSWTFRKHPKFFNVQTWSTSYNDQPYTLAVDLQSDLGMAIFKSTDATGQANNWIVWHKDLNDRTYLRLNTSDSVQSDPTYGPSYNSATKQFTFRYPMSNTADRLISGSQETTNWVGYFFAHHNGNGGFGPNSDQDIIKCGSYTGNGVTDGPAVDIGFEPQYIMIKSVASGDWQIFDTTRGIVSDYNNGAQDKAFNQSNAPEVVSTQFLSLLPNGFKLETAASNLNQASTSFFYIAIRADFDLPVEREVLGSISSSITGQGATAGGNSISVTLNGLQTGDYILAVQGANGAHNYPNTDIRSQMTMSTGALTELGNQWSSDTEGAANMKVWGGFYNGVSNFVWDGLSDTNAGHAVVVRVFSGVSGVTTPVIAGAINGADIGWPAIQNITPGNWLVLGGVGAIDSNATYQNPGDGSFWNQAFNTSTLRDVAVGMLVYNTQNTKMYGGKTTLLDRPSTWSISSDTGDSSARFSIQLQPISITQSIQEQVFAVDRRGYFGFNPPNYHTNYVSQNGFKVDFSITKITDSVINADVSARTLQNRYQSTQNTNPTAARTANQYDYNEGFYDSQQNDFDELAYMWKRARGYFDIVHYTGNGVGNGDSQTVSHNLGVIPEMAVWKSKSNGGRWVTYINGIGTSHRLFLEDTAVYQTENLGSPGLTTTTFNALHYTNGVFPKYTTNSSGVTYAAYLFASLDGVSKVGTFNADGTDVTVDCGFANGAKFIITKIFQDGESSDWRVFDSIRGYSTVSDPYWALNSSASQVTGSDLLAQTNSGFIVKTANWTAGNYVFYAVAN